MLSAASRTCCKRMGSASKTMDGVSQQGDSGAAKLEVGTHAAATVAADRSSNINAEGGEMGTVCPQNTSVGFEVHDVDGVVAAAHVM